MQILPEQAVIALKPSCAPADINSIPGRESLERGISMSTDPANVLIVDDEPHVCHLISDGLSERGFVCTAVSKPKEALDMLVKNAYDVCVTDIIMPEVDGLDLLQFAREHCPACKMVLITALSNTDNLARALWLGAYDYFQKPFEIDRLVETVTHATMEKGQCSHLASKAANAIQMESQLRIASLESIRALVGAVEAKDPYTRRHS